MRMDRVREISAQLDNDPDYVFESFQDTIDVIGYRAADSMIRSQQRRKLFDEKLGIEPPKPVGRFWKNFGWNPKRPYKPVNLEDTY